jgi:hypothetical protein
MRNRKPFAASNQVMGQVGNLPARVNHKVVKQVTNWPVRLNRPIIAAVAVSLTLIANGLPGVRGLGVNRTSSAAGSGSGHQTAVPAGTSAAASSELSFEPNVGQAPEEARFIARGPGYSLMLTDDGPVIVSGGNQPDNVEGGHNNRTRTAPMPHGKAARGRLLMARAEQLRASEEAAGQGDAAGRAAADVEEDNGAKWGPPEGGTTNGSRSVSAGGGPMGASEAVIRFRFVGATPTPAITGLDRLASTTSYFIGADPAGWHPGVANYAKVKYEGVYPGIDLVYYGSKGNLEYDAVVAPGADSAVIQLEVEGAQSLRIDGDGQLVAETAGGPIRQAQPHIYQMIAGTRQMVTGGYQLTGPNRAGFAIGQYDHSRELVIDPDVIYTTTIGGSQATFADAIATDSQGNAYVSGGTTSSDFPTKNPVDGTLKGMQNAFITKLDPQGNVLFSTFLGGSGIDEAFGIGVDSTGIYVGGATSSRDFPTTSGGLQSPAGGFDAFAAKLSIDGTSLVYSSLLGGSGDDIAFGIAVSPGQGLPAGSVVITGLTKSTNLPTKSPFQGSNLNPRGTAFVTAFDQTGKALIYSSYLGGSGADAANGIAIDAEGNAYITGTTNSPNFPATAGVLQSKANGGLDAFISAVSPAGALTASTFLGATGDDQGVAIAVVPNAPGDQDVIVACSTTSSGLTSGPNPIQTGFMGKADAYIAEIDHTLQIMKNGTYFGGGNTTPIALAVDSVKNICVAGATDDGADIPIIFPAALQAPNPGKNNAFLTVFNFNFPTPFPFNVITSSAFSLGSNDSDITASTLVKRSSIGTAGQAGSQEARPVDTIAADRLSVKSVGTSSASSQQQTTVINTQFGSVEFTKDATKSQGYPPLPPAISSASEGDYFYFRFLVHNNTSKTIVGLTVQDDIASNLVVGYIGGNIFLDAGSTALDNPGWSQQGQHYQLSFGLEPGRLARIYLRVECRKGGLVTNTATLAPLGATASCDITLLPHLGPIIGEAEISGKALTVRGANLAPNSSHRFTGDASGPVILIDGVTQKTVPDSTYPDAILIAPKAGKKIAPGQTVTVQVQFPDGSTTNSITYTRPTG